MSRNRKYFPNKAVVFCSSRTETGLPFVSSYNMNYILEGILARASELYDVSICHGIFMANHFHMLIVVNNPEDVSAFFGYVKTESSHAVNRLLGRAQRTIWEDGYDSPIVLTADKVEHYIKYIYLNPVSANLVESIKDYPGVSSWEMFSSGSKQKQARRLRRSSIEALDSPALSINEQKRLVAHYNTLPGTTHTLTLEPNAWMDCFDELVGVDRDTLNNRLMEEIAAEEDRLKKRRAKENKSVVGATRLRRESMSKEYEPTKRSLRMICLSTCKEIRKAFVEAYRLLSQQAQEVYLSWKRGDLTDRIPPGMFAPRVPSLCSALRIT